MLLTSSFHLNLSLDDPNIATVLFPKNRKLCPIFITCRDVKAGEELLSFYEEMAYPEWVEILFKQHEAQSMRQWFDSEGSKL
jgi:hypothetical protein